MSISERLELTESSLRVRQITREEWGQLQLKLQQEIRETVSVSDNGKDWEETDSKRPIENAGAGPCLIVYVTGVSNEGIISGHFSNTRETNVNRAIRNEIAGLVQLVLLDKSEPIDVSKYQSTILINAADIFLDSFQEYQRFLERVAQERKSGNSKGVQAYLFGQNFEPLEEMQKRYDTKRWIGQWTSALVERSNTILDLVACGIPAVSIFDYRVPEGSESVTDTIYLPAEGIFYCN